jgi:hypothetical protein
MNLLEASERKSMSPTQQTLVDIYHPKFREGYQMGRKHYFREQSTLTDKDLVECLQFFFEGIEPEKAAKIQEELYESIGRLIGQISGRVIACQPHEDSTQDLREAFLLKVKRKYGATGQALISTIGQFWAMQDQLALTLDADTFEQVLHGGVEKG